MLTSASQIPNGAIKTYEILPSEIGLIESGMALVQVYQNGKGYAARSTGAATDSDNFIGVAFIGTERRLTSVFVKTAKFTVSASTLTYTGANAVATVAGSTTPSVYKVNPVTGAITYLTLNAGAPAAGQFQVTSLAPITILFNVADAGDVYVSYNANPVIEDLQFMSEGYRPAAYGGIQSADVVMNIGVLSQGRIFTDKFVAGNAWATGGALCVAAGGYFTLAGDAIDSAPVFGRLYSAPTTEQGIGIDLNW